MPQHVEAIKHHIFMCKKCISWCNKWQLSLHVWNKCQNLKQAAQKRNKITDDTKSRYTSETSELMMAMTCAKVFEQHYRCLSV